MRGQLESLLTTLLETHWKQRKNSINAHPHMLLLWLYTSIEDSRLVHDFTVGFTFTCRSSGSLRWPLGSRHSWASQTHQLRCSPRTEHGLPWFAHCTEHTDDGSLTTVTTLNNKLASVQWEPMSCTYTVDNCMHLGNIWRHRLVVQSPCTSVCWVATCYKHTTLTCRFNLVRESGQRD